MSLLLEASDLTVSYNGRPALFLPRFEVACGETVAILGPNGSGKSTLLRLLAFLEKPDSGSIRYHGGASSARREITLLLQEPCLLKCSVFANVVKGLRFRGINHDLEAEYASAMRLAGFDQPEKYARRRCHELSGGERQRVALAARLVLNPRLLLLDEPTSNVDAKSSAQIVKALENFRSAGTGIVCATHDPALIAALKPRCVELKAAEQVILQ